MKNELISAITEGNIAEVEKFLKNNTISETLTKRSTWDKALLWECISGELEIVQLLLNHEANVNAKGQYNDPLDIEGVHTYANRRNYV